MNAPAFGPDVMATGWSPKSKPKSNFDKQNKRVLAKEFDGHLNDQI